jgi:hypothetical protein
MNQQQKMTMVSSLTCESWRSLTGFEIRAAKLLTCCTLDHDALHSSPCFPLCSQTTRLYAISIADHLSTVCAQPTHAYQHPQYSLQGETQLSPRHCSISRLLCYRLGLELALQFHILLVAPTSQQLDLHAFHPQKQRDRFVHQLHLHSVTITYPKWLLRRLVEDGSLEYRDQTTSTPDCKSIYSFASARWLRPGCFASVGPP